MIPCWIVTRGCLGLPLWAVCGAALQEELPAEEKSSEKPSHRHSHGAECWVFEWGIPVGYPPMEPVFNGVGVAQSVMWGRDPTVCERRNSVYVRGLQEGARETHPMLCTMWWRLLCWPAWASSQRAVSLPLPQAAGQRGSVTIKFHIALIKMLR